MRLEAGRLRNGAESRSPLVRSVSMALFCLVQARGLALNASDRTRPWNWGPNFDCLLGSLIPRSHAVVTPISTCSDCSVRILVSLVGLTCPGRDGAMSRVLTRGEPPVTSATECRVGPCPWLPGMGLDQESGSEKR